MLQISNLTKFYNDFKAIDDISFNIKPNEIVGFLGPNGAGKSTTLNIITGNTSYDRGSIVINGIDLLVEPEKAKKNIGFLPDTPPLYTEFLVHEYLNFVCELKKVPKKDIKNMIAKIVKLTKLEGYENKLIKNLSKGYCQRVGIASAICGFPNIIILDEPINTLDPKQIIEIRDLLKELSKNHSILISSHILSEISNICDRIIIINKGKIIVENSKDNLLKDYSKNSTIYIRVKTTKESALTALENNPNFETIEYLGSFEDKTSDFNIMPANNKDIREELFYIFSDLDIPILYISKNDFSLEEIFIKLTMDNYKNELSSQ